MKIFFDKPSRISNWLSAKGYGGTTVDALTGYFHVKSDLAEGTLFDLVNDTLADLGYAGSIEDKLTAFFQEKTGVTGRMDAERSFWANTSLDFSGGGTTLLAEDGSTLLAEDGSSLLPE